MEEELKNQKRGPLQDDGDVAKRLRQLEEERKLQLEEKRQKDMENKRKIEELKEQKDLHERQ